MADIERERAVLDFYQISSLKPETLVQWPTEKDRDSDASEDESVKKKANRRKSRYQALERAVSTRSSFVPGSETSGSGVANLVQRDEPDPLGSTDSVVRTLKQLGVPLQDDLKLRKFVGNRVFDIPRYLLGHVSRQPIPPLLDDLLTSALPIPNARHSRYPIPPQRSRHTVSIDRPKIRLPESAGRIQL